MWSPKPCHMFSSRLYPLFVRAVSFQTCGSTSLQQCYYSFFKSFCRSVQRSLLATLLESLLKG
ncbi:hypothetical protein ASG16_011655 [Brevibacillus sp. Leaf182]|nr:hypothetical protein ASG16_011655 [Brevibacillus sp. Leaf182]